MKIILSQKDYFLGSVRQHCRLSICKKKIVFDKYRIWDEQACLGSVRIQMKFALYVHLSKRGKYAMTVATANVLLIATFTFAELEKEGHLVDHKWRMYYTEGWIIKHPSNLYSNVVRTMCLPLFILISQYNWPKTVFLPSGFASTKLVKRWLHPMTKMTRKMI